MAEPDDAAAVREDRRRRKVFNERLKLLVNYAHAVALAVLGFGVLRFALDPAAAPLELGRLAYVAVASLAVEGWAAYLLRYLKPED
jgi:hypothetical protein